MDVLSYMAGKKRGGESGGVTKEYVDAQVGAVSERVSDVESVIPSTATPQNPLATTADVQNEEITFTSTTSPISTASGNLRKIAIYGKSEVVDGDIHSAGEGGSIEVRTSGKNLFGGNYNEMYQIFIPANTTFTISTSKLQSGEYPRIRAYDKSETIIDYWNINSERNSRYYRTFTLSYDVYYVQIYHTTVSDIQLEFNATMSAYEPYNGTMATFTTGTPLRGIPDTDIRDVMQWDGSSGEVTKSCGVLNMGGLNWAKSDNGRMYTSPITEIKRPADRNTLPNIVNPIYMPDTDYNVGNLTTDKTIAIGNDCRIYVYDTDYTDPAAFKSAMNGVKLVYELATPTTEQFTASENTSFAALQTYSPQTAIAINDNPEYELEAYAGTANGQAVADIQTDLQGQIDDKITVSSTLTLAANAWSNNTQTVTFAHDTTKRNVIDITPSEVPAWAAAGVYASAETSTGITFTCATVPETALTFKVTSMEVS